MRRPETLINHPALTRFAGLLLVVGWSATSPAQTAPPPAPDPAVALLTSQPQIDTTSPVEATAEFDPPVIRPGGTATYRVTFNALQDSIKWPEDVIAPDALTLRASARGQIFSSLGGQIRPFTTFNYRTTAGAAGTFTAPRFLVYVYGKPVTVPAAQLTVVTNPATPVPAALQLHLETDATHPFIGQPVNVRITLPAGPGGIVQALSMVTLNGAGFMSDPLSARQMVKPLNQGGSNVTTFIYETTITPIQAGRIELSAQGFTAGNRFSGPIVITGQAVIPGGVPRYVLLDTPPVTLQVRPVPREGELPGYNGAIGQFQLDTPVLTARQLHVGDPLTLTVNVRGEGNLARLVPPPPPAARGWRVFAGEPDKAPAQLIQARGFTTFTYTLIPITTTEATPVIPFSYFDPDKAKFVNLSIPAVPVHVAPGTAPVDLTALGSTASTPATREREPTLGALAPTPGRTMTGLVSWQNRGGFLLAQTLPALVLGGLWWWDRRRRLFAAHPEILLRRRARRALRRERTALRKAASHGDTPRFTACAVNALRVACAPHYPAEPRALVSSDVLPLLVENQRAAELGAVVRHLFAAADAERFAAQTAPAKDLLSLRTDLETVLAWLEEKLQ
ncbi:MAG TPA: hypothetical protein VFV96_08520 [Verrucomicrobiae bacterium]|nr:hypothetical protein [Verrucomicrobiae bacterium]